MLFGAVFFTSLVVAIRAMSDAGYTAFEVVFYRALIGALVQLPWLFRRGVGVLTTTHLPVHGVRVMFAYAGMVCYFYALGNMPVATATAFQFTLPLFVTLLAVLALGERIGVRRVLALMIGFSGVLVMLRPGIIEISLAAFLALISTTFYSVSHILIKVATRRGEASDVTVFYGFLLTLPIAAVPMFFVGHMPNWADLPGLVAIGVFSTLAHVGLVRAFAHGDASVVTPFDFIRLPMTAAVGLVFFAEWPDLWTWVGAFIIFTAVTYIARREMLAVRRSGAG